MVQVSNLFRQKIYANERTIKARVSFELLDVNAYTDASFTVSGEALLSRLGQSINKVRTMSYKYATFERDYFKLDGTCHIPPKENEGDSELGWWSDVISTADGTFTIPPVMEFTFLSPHNSVGLTITFDDQAVEYASDFRIEVFDDTGTLIVNQTVTGNTGVVYFLNTPLDNYTRIVITILKWAKPFRRCRLVEVDFGSVYEYRGDKLISLKILEEMDLLSSLVPSNEMQFTLDNSDQIFNILNPNGLYRFLQPNQEIRADLGLLIGEEKYEWIPMGTYYLSEWTVEEGAMTSSFVARDIFNKIDLEEYTNLLQNVTLYDLAVDVLNQANVKKYSIDEKLKTITTVGFKEMIKTREALQMIAIAGKSVVRQGRDGSLIIEQFEELAFESGYVSFLGSDLFASPTTYPQVDIDYNFNAITFENAYEIPKTKLATPVTHLIFKINQSDGTVVDAKFINTNVKNGIGYEINNPLINTTAHATEIADWSFREYSFIAEYTASWRQNPALECGNIILIEDNFDNKKKSRITKQEYNYSGYLNGITEAKGGI